jgi:hypothetical protein
MRPLFDPTQRSTRQLQILELGSGCGAVGIGLAHIVSNAHFILTDLPEAMEILESNISEPQNQIVSSNKIEARVLDWDCALKVPEPSLMNDGERLQSLVPDLVILSDCTYNPSSFKSLVAILRKVVQQGKEAHKSKYIGLDVLLALKVRHESEAQFFEEMNNAGFKVVGFETVEFPDRSKSDIGLELEKSEIYGFDLVMETKEEG